MRVDRIELQIMLADQGDFLKRLLHQGREGQPYWITARPTPEVLQKAATAIKDEIGFDAHLSHFRLLTEVIDFCVAEYVDSMSGKGSAFQNTLKHPRILALANLEGKERTGVICAAAQGIKWIDEIQPWVHEHTLQNEIAKRVMIGILRDATKVKKCFTATDLNVLIRLGSSIKGQDSYGIIAQMAIVEILASNAANLQLDDKTCALLSRYLDDVASQSDLKGILKAIDKLKSKLETKQILCQKE
jgi:hypothetical protein